MKKNICFIHVGMERDGAERVIASLANEFAKRGFCVDIIVLLKDVCGYDLDDNVRIVSLVQKNKNRVASIPSWIAGIRKHITKSNPQYIISFSMYVNIFTLLACTGLKKRVLISERNDPTSDGRAFIEDALTKILYRKADKIVLRCCISF